jgi:hypothetical protein
MISQDRFTRLYSGVFQAAATFPRAHARTRECSTRHCDANTGPFYINEGNRMRSR